MVSFLYFDGFKIKDGRSPGVAGILFDAPTATYHQDNAYTDSPLHGLWKIADDRVISSNMFLSAKYAYFNTGFVLDPVGGLDQQAGRELRDRAVVRLGRARASTSARRRWSTSTCNNFVTAMGATPRPEVRLRLPHASTRSAARSGRATASSRSSARRPTCRRRCSARATAATAPTTWTSTSATRSRATAMTLDLGLRYDRQWGKALPSDDRRPTRRSRTSCPASRSPATTRRSRGRTSRRARA